VTLEGEPWFVVKDVLKVLGMTHTSMSVRNLDATEKGSNRIATPGGPQSLVTVSESGLYKLIMRSDKPEAKRFQDWRIDSCRNALA
jgi:anti-repressor protein